MMYDGISVRFESASGSGESFSSDATNSDKFISIDKLSDRVGIGFESGSFMLSRREDLRFPTPRELQRATVYAPGNQIIWQGRVQPIAKGTGKNKIEAAGLFQAFRDKPFPQIFIDQDVSKWGGMPLNRVQEYLTANYAPVDGAVADGSIRTTLASPPWTSPGLPVSESWYTAPPGVNIASITGRWQRSTTSVDDGGTDANYFWACYISTADSVAAAYDSTGDLQAAGPAAFSVSATVTGRRYGVLGLSHATTNATADSVDRAIAWNTLAVKGDHGLTNIYASEVLKYLIGATCPSLTYTADSIDDTTYEIGHLVMDADQTTADILPTLIGYHLWQLMVWENGTVYFKPAKVQDDYDFLLDRSAGDTFMPASQGTDKDQSINQIHVIYNSVTTGRTERLTSTDDASLADASDDNPCNIEGIDRTATLKVDRPTTADDAGYLGSLWLQENRLPTRAGAGTCGRYVRNRAGQIVPSYEMRSGDRIRYAHDESIFTLYGKTINTDGSCDLEYDDAPMTSDGIAERIGAALQLVGIS